MIEFGICVENKKKCLISRKNPNFLVKYLNFGRIHHNKKTSSVIDIDKHIVQNRDEV